MPPEDQLPIDQNQAYQLLQEQELERLKQEELLAQQTGAPPQAQNPAFDLLQQQEMARLRQEQNDITAPENLMEPLGQTRTGNVTVADPTDRAEQIQEQEANLEGLPPIIDVKDLESEGGWEPTREQEVSQETQNNGLMELPSPNEWEMAGERQKKAIADGVAAEQEGNALVADVYERASREITDTKTALAELAAKRTAAIDAETQKLSDLKEQNIDVNRWWNDKSTGTQIALVVGAALGGAAQALGGGPNAVLAQINAGINRDIAAQKNALTRGQQIQGSILSAAMKKYDDQEQAILASKILSLEKVQNQVKGLSARTSSQLAKSNADGLAAKIDEDIQGKLYQLQLAAGTRFNATAAKNLKEQASLQYQTGPLKGINERITDPKQRQAAIKELTGYQQTQQVLAAVQEVEDTLKPFLGANGFLTMVPGSDALATYEAKLTNLENIIRQAAKAGGHFSDDDARVIRPFFPSKKDLILNRSSIRFEEARKFIRNKTPPLTVLKSYGIDPRFGTSSVSTAAKERPMTTSQVPTEIRLPSSDLASLVDKSNAPKDPAIREDIKKAIATAAEGDKKVENILFVLGRKESNFDPAAKAKTSSASGMFQQIDSTAARYGSIKADVDKNGNVLKIHEDNRKDYWVAANAAGKHIRFLLSEFNDNPYFASMAYYGGEGTVKKALLLGGGKIDPDKKPPKTPQAIWNHMLAYGKDTVEKLGEEVSNTL